MLENPPNLSLIIGSPSSSLVSISLSSLGFPSRILHLDESPLFFNHQHIAAYASKEEFFTLWSERSQQASEEMAASDDAVATKNVPLLPKEQAQGWVTKTTFGVLVGMVYGGCREAMVFLDKEETLLAHQSAEINYRQWRNLLRAVMEEKVLRVARGTTMGGAKLGVFTGLFCATEQYLAFQHSTHDTLNVVAAGGLTAATVGFLLPGSFSWRLRSALLGFILGVAFGVPLDLLQSTLLEYVEKDKLEDGPLSAGHGQQESAPYNDAFGTAHRVHASTEGVTKYLRPLVAGFPL